MCLPSNEYFIVRYGYILKKNTGIRSRTKYLKVSNGILFIFCIHSIYKQWKGKIENKSTTCEFLLQISQNHLPNRVCPPSFSFSLLFCLCLTFDIYIYKEKINYILISIKNETTLRYIVH